jgi:hypothetical protein
MIFFIFSMHEMFMFMCLGIIIFVDTFAPVDEAEGGGWKIGGFSLCQKETKKKMSKRKRSSCSFHSVINM